MNAPDLELKVASAVSRMPWKLRREVYIGAASVLGMDPNILADQSDDHLESWRPEEGDSR